MTNSGYNYKIISGTAAGTTTVLTTSGNLHQIFFPTTRTGTATFYDTNGATAAAKQIFSLVNTAGTPPMPLTLDYQCKQGLVVVVGGTTDLMVATL
jgi:hypothetical protein